MRGTKLTNMRFGVVVTIIGAAATSKDEINMQMGADAKSVTKAVVKADAAHKNPGSARTGLGSGAEACKHVPGQGIVRVTACS